MAGKKAAPAANAVAPDEQVPYLDPELARIRDEQLAAEPDVKVVPAGEPTIDAELVEARKKALEAEKHPKTIGSL